jgi:hypothetical protein
MADSSTILFVILQRDYKSNRSPIDINLSKFS